MSVQDSEQQGFVSREMGKRLRQGLSVLRRGLLDRSSSRSAASLSSDSRGAGFKSRRCAISSSFSWSLASAPKSCLKSQMSRRRCSSTKALAPDAFSPTCSYVRIRSIGRGSFLTIGHMSLELCGNIPKRSLPGSETVECHFTILMIVCCDGILRDHQDFGEHYRHVSWKRVELARAMG